MESLATTLEIPVVYISIQNSEKQHEFPVLAMVSPSPEICPPDPLSKLATAEDWFESDRLSASHVLVRKWNCSHCVRLHLRSSTGRNYYPKMHAIQCRINAEDPFKGFAPSPGRITSYHSPGGHGVRLDIHAYAGYVIPPYYDSMISKLIVVAQTREEAITKMERALDEYIIEGIKTTIPFHQKLMKDEKFRAGDFTTKFMDTFEL